MVSIYSVDANNLIEKVAQELKKSDLVHPTEWAKFVKTGVAKERPPVDDDWWYFRAAAILRSVYKLGPVGVSKLRTKYGSKQNRGVRPEKFRDASGNIIRTILQQLEKDGYIMQNKDDKKKGRVIAPKGQSLLEKTASSLARENLKSVDKQNPKEKNDSKKVEKTIESKDTTESNKDTTESNKDSAESKSADLAESKSNDSKHTKEENVEKKESPKVEE